MTFCSWAHTVSKNHSCTHRQTQTVTSAGRLHPHHLLHRSDTWRNNHCHCWQAAAVTGTMTLLIADWSGFYSAAAGVYVCLFWQSRANFISICLGIFILCTGCHRITLTCWSVRFLCTRGECRAIHCGTDNVASGVLYIELTKAFSGFPIGHIC